MSLPALTVQVQGQGSVSADQLNTMMQNCTTAAVLRDFIGITGMAIWLDGISSVDDGHAGAFYWNPTGTAPDDNLNIIVPHAAPPTGGEWQRFSASNTTITLNGDVAGPANANIIQPGVVTTGKIADQAITTGLIANGAVGTNQITNTAITTAKIASQAITNALLANMANNTFKGNTSGSPAAPQDIPISTLQSIIGLVPGSVAVQGYSGTISGSVLTQIASFGGITVARNGVGLYTATLGNTALVMGHGNIGATFPGATSQRDWYFLTNAPYAANTTVQFQFQNASNNNAEPQSFIVQFF